MARRTRQDPVPNKRLVNFYFTCGKTFHSTRGCFYHNLAKHSFQTMDCGTCGTTFSTNIFVKEHHQRFHVDNANIGIQCQTCATFSENRNQNCKPVGNFFLQETRVGEGGSWSYGS